MVSGYLTTEVEIFNNLFLLLNIPPRESNSLNTFHFELSQYLSFQ